MFSEQLLFGRYKRPTDSECIPNSTRDDKRERESETEKETELIHLNYIPTTQNF